MSIDTIFYNTGVFTIETFIRYPIYDFKLIIYHTLFRKSTEKLRQIIELEYTVEDSNFTEKKVHTDLF